MAFGLQLYNTAGSSLKSHWLSSRFIIVALISEKDSFFENIAA
jgi:hypothetical protein